jgi:hypothetical protein
MLRLHWLPTLLLCLVIGLAVTLGAARRTPLFALQAPVSLLHSFSSEGRRILHSRLAYGVCLTGSFDGLVAYSACQRLAKAPEDARSDRSRRAG